MPAILRFTLAAVLLGSAVTSSASIQSDWPLLALAEQSDCELQIAGNGKFMEVRAFGFAPGEPLNFTLTNGDMKPIKRRVLADGAGRWQQLYIPFRFGRDGGTVVAAIRTSSCALSASAPWYRGVRTID